MTINGLYVAIEAIEIGALRPFLRSSFSNEENTYSKKTIIKCGLRFIVIYDLEGTLLQDHQALSFSGLVLHMEVIQLKLTDALDTQLTGKRPFEHTPRVDRPPSALSIATPNSRPATQGQRSKVRLSPLAYRAYCGFGHPVWIVVHSKCELEFHWTRSVNLLTFCVDAA